MLVSTPEAIQSVLSVKPDIEDLCSLPVENIWYPLGLWLGLKQNDLETIKNEIPIEDNNDCSSDTSVSSCDMYYSDSDYFQYSDEDANGDGDDSDLEFEDNAAVDNSDDYSQLHLDGAAQEFDDNSNSDDYSQLHLDCAEEAPGPSKMCLNGMFKKFLNNSVVKPTSEAIVVALVKLGKREIAESFAKCKGMFGNKAMRQLTRSGLLKHNNHRIRN